MWMINCAIVWMIYCAIAMFICYIWIEGGKCEINCAITKQTISNYTGSVPVSREGKSMVT